MLLLVYLLKNHSAPYMVVPFVDPRMLAPCSSIDLIPLKQLLLSLYLLRFNLQAILCKEVDTKNHIENN